MAVFKRLGATLPQRDTETRQCDPILSRLCLQGAIIRLLALFCVADAAR